MLAEVGASGGHLARRAHERDRALGRQAARVELGRRAARQPGRRGRRAQRAAGAPAPVAAHDAALDRGRAAGLDQLLADRPGERLEGLGPPARAQPRPAADHRPDQRVPAKAAVERAQVVVDAQSAKRMRSIPSTAASCDPASARMRTARRRAHARTTHLLLADPEHPRERAVARDHHAVAPGARKPVRPGGDDVLLDRGGYRSFRRWTSTRNERVAATSTSCRGSGRRQAQRRLSAAGAARARAGR